MKISLTIINTTNADSHKIIQLPKLPSLPPKLPSLPPKLHSLPPKLHSLPPKLPSLPPKLPSLPPKLPSLPPKLPSLPPKLPNILHLLDKDIYIVDSCSYGYYRCCATLSWWRKCGRGSIEDPEFISALERQYLAGLSAFSPYPLKEIITVRDCPVDEIWRRKLYSLYKANRTGKSQVGGLLKHLNKRFSHEFGICLRVNTAEADDTIAILVQWLIRNKKNKKIYILTSDSDYIQLKEPNVTIIDPRQGYTPLQGKSLETKLCRGDKSDNIPASIGHRLIRNLIDMNYIPRSVQNKVLMAALGPSYPYSVMDRPQSIQLGLCCMRMDMRSAKPPVFCGRTLRLETVRKKGLQEIYTKATQNCYDLLTILKQCIKDGIRVMRISSDIFPHKGNPQIDDYSLDFAQPILDQIGSLSREYRIRLTFHPGQYNVVGTPHEDIFSKTVSELDWHAEVLDRMGCDNDSIMVVHGGGIYGNKPLTIERWINNFYRLPERVQRRLVLENCEKCFHIRDCLYISDRVGVPVVFDTHHFECYSILHPKEDLGQASDYMKDVMNTWHRRGIKPKFHISEQRQGSNVGAHSDLIQTIPDYILNLQDIDLMVEAKHKELAIFHLWKLYPQLNPSNQS
jgi:UV damage endonuclease UvdE